MGIQDNFAFAEVPAERLAAMIRSVAARKPDAISVLCTNLRSALLSLALEAELGIPIYDTVATAVWKSLHWQAPIRPTWQAGGGCFNLSPDAGLPARSIGRR